MNQVRRWQRIFILSLLLLSVLTPIVFVYRLKSITSVDKGEFIEELSDITDKTDDDLRLTAVEQDGEVLEEPKRILQDREFNSVVSSSSADKSNDTMQSNEGDKTTLLSEIDGGNNHKTKEEQALVAQKTTISSNAEVKLPARDIQRNRKPEFRPPSGKSEKIKRVQPERATDERVKEIRDKIIQARAYLNLALPGNNSQIVKELRVRTKELERAIGDVTKDKHLPKSSPNRLKAMEAALYKVSRAFHNCPAIAIKLQAMTYKTEEQARAQKKHAAYLMQLAARTTPKGLHCLSMRLTTEYFTLDHEKRQLFQQSYNNPDLYHYVVFSDNVLACAVVVNSTISSSKEPGKIVFHVVTDSLNYPAISMWFLLNPSKASIQILNIDEMSVLPLDHAELLMKQNSSDPRIISGLNHARFYLPDIFPGLNKIVLFDHDVVVQSDLSRLWSLDMKGKVIGAVETCLEGEPSFQSMEKLINFSDAWVAQKFDPKACTWAFGMNLFDLEEWRRQDLTSVYLKYFELGVKRHLWKAGSLPIGWLTFFGQTYPLEKRWNMVGLGHESGVRASDIEKAAVIHYDGIMKPWLDIGIDKYKRYWNIHVPYNHPYLQRCNIHD
ncbi:hypothetical protein CARUB_v10025075mg [Capsella rubella]|uniref:Hexosyltransferase n=1 Tax=Capsella rubella TaxID=81985 RepID=R0G0V2_9BRAS|nr:probable galacturonosyltransferase 5 isoform X2 [Capsella rubella]EOA28836.1 hypothetical protein CARUB_v10025075mg [Capsella rubella]